MNTAVPGTRAALRAADLMKISIGRPASFIRLIISWRPCAQVVSKVKAIAPTSSGNQPPAGTLVQVGREIGAVDGEEEGQQRRHGVPVPVPHLPEHDRDQHAVDEHRAGHRDAIGGGEVGRAAERQDEQDDHDHQRPVDHRDVDLPRRALAGVGDAKARDEAELHRLLGHRKGAGDHRLAGDDRRAGREEHQRQAEHVGRSRRRMDCQASHRPRRGPSDRIIAPWPI